MCTPQLVVLWVLEVRYIPTTHWREGSRPSFRSLYSSWSGQRWRPRLKIRSSQPYYCCDGVPRARGDCVWRHVSDGSSWIRLVLGSDRCAWIWSMFVSTRSFWIWPAFEFIVVFASMALLIYVPHRRRGYGCGALVLWGVKMTAFRLFIVIRFIQLQ